MIVNYSSDSENEGGEKKGILVHKIDLNPAVSTMQLELNERLEMEKKLKLLYPERQEENHVTGKLSNQEMNSLSFVNQYYNYKTFGYASNPTILSDEIILKESDDHRLSLNVYDANTKEMKLRKNEIKKKREQDWNPSTGNFKGPWAGYELEREMLTVEGLSQEKKDILNEIETRRKQKLQEKNNYREEFEPSSVFHGKELNDYQGRSYLTPPSHLKQTPHVCYIPKKQVHTYVGHTKACQAVRFFPKYGHFILSASNDCKVKLWDVYNDKKCVRTYSGHTEAVRDIYFTNDGLHFLSAGWDKRVQYWDTETGQVVRTFELKKYPFTVRFNPDNDKQSSFLVGSTNTKISQYDVRSGTRTQVYDEHLGPVNTLTFIDNNRKFVSTSDDKKIFVWEFGIPVVVKHISEPEMHAISSATLHPNGKYYAGQCSENKIVIYDGRTDNFRCNRKKTFTGHLCAGYCINICFSVDGQFLCSGDADGNLWFWDWKTAKNYRTIQAHTGVCNGVEWHPLEPSKLVTCGWDGLVKFWD